MPESSQCRRRKKPSLELQHIIDEGPDGVIASYGFVNFNAGNAPMAAQIMTSGRIQDKVVRTAEGWKIAYRYVRFDQAFELDF